MNRYIVTVEFAGGDRVEAAVIARNKKDAIKRVMASEDYAEFASGREPSSYSVRLDVIKPVDNARLSVSVPVGKKGWYIVSDRESGISVEWKRGHYNDIQNVTGGNGDAVSMATALREIGDFVRDNFYSIAFCESIRERIIRRIQEKGETQKDLAELIGSSPQEVNAFLRGRQVISFEKLERIFKVLGL